MSENDPTPQKVEKEQKNSSEKAEVKKTPAKKSNKSMWIVLGSIAAVLFLGFIGVIIAGIVLVSNVTKDITATSDKVVIAVQNEDSDSLYTLASRTFTDATPISEVVSTLAQISPLLKGSTFSVTSTSIEKNSGSPETAVVDYKIKTDDGTIYMQVTLEKENDTWELLNFQTSKTAFESDSSN